MFLRQYARNAYMVVVMVSMQESALIGTSLRLWTLTDLKIAMSIRELSNVSTKRISGDLKKMMSNIDLNRRT